MLSINRQWVLKTRPRGLVEREHFEFRDAPVPEPGPGEMLVKTLYLSFDPTQRGWLNTGPGYVPPVEIGEPMRAGAVGQVVTSNMEGFAPGDFVQGTFSWQDYVVTGPRKQNSTRHVLSGVHVTMHGCDRTLRH